MGQKTRVGSFLPSLSEGVQINETFIFSTPKISVAAPVPNILISATGQPKSHLAWLYIINSPILINGLCTPLRRNVCPSQLNYLMLPLRGKPLAMTEKASFKVAPKWSFFVVLNLLSSSCTTPIKVAQIKSVN